MKNKTIILFGILNLVQGAVIGAVPIIAESREPLVNWLLGTVAISMLIAGPALVFGGRIGRMIAALACLVHGVVGTAFATLIAGSASYLYGIYGHHGHSIGAIAFVLVGFVLFVFWLIPAHELLFLKRYGQSQ
ncbi:MAG: hypothetical protein GY847_19335 [Proteobacteria bacterium]|nr:hypothetical protein [Pseudomonadota bacterium]